MKLKSISQSKLKGWEYCRAGFYYQYILGIDGYNPNFEGGHDYHKSVELYHQKLDKSPRSDHRGNPLSGEDIYDPELIKHYRGACDCSDKLAHPSVAADKVLTHEDGHVMVEERIENIFLQHPRTGESLPLPMTLVIDRVVSEDKLSDLKTSNAAWNQDKVDKDIQATIYSFAWWQITGVLPEFEFVVVRKNPGPRTKALDIFTTNRDISDFAEIWDWAKLIIQEIQLATEYPCTCYDGAHRNIGLVL